MWMRDSASRERFAAARAAEGDTLSLVAGFSYSSRLRMTDVTLLLPLMRDPGLAFQYGIPRDVAFTRVLELLLMDPPAIQPDTAKWRCEPAACRAIAAEYATATEPRLKSAALAVLALTEPRRWRDTLVARARAGDQLLQAALPLATGQFVRGPLLAEWPALPPSNADWTAWRDWVRGPASQLPSSPVGGRGAGSPPPPRWLQSRGDPTPIRFEQAASGRDIVGELRALFSDAADDTARVVIGNLLAGLRALPWTIDSVAAQMKTGTPLRRAFAGQVLADGQFAFAAAADSTTQVIQEQYLTAVSNHREPWRTLEELKAGRPVRGFRDPPTDALGKLSVYYATDSLSAVVRDRWSDRIRLMSHAEWDARPAREGGELWTISRADQAGPFVRVRVTVAGRNTRAANQGPNAWYSWTTYYLMNVGGEWVIVHQTTAVT